MTMHHQIPVTLTIAGSDNSAGAGIQADLKTFSALGCYGLTTLTCVVAEVPGRVARIQAVEEEVVREQIRLSLETFPVRAIKTGMLYSSCLVRAVVEELEVTFAHLESQPFLVVDPVMMASSGDLLLAGGAIHEYRERLLPLASLITPNLDELRLLTGEEIHDLETLRRAGRKLSEEYGCAVLAKGGHLKGDTAIDILVEKGETHEFTAAFLSGVDTHGTGCSLSSAITAGLASGLSMADAVKNAKRYVTGAIYQHYTWGAIHALNHFPTL